MPAEQDKIATLRQAAAATREAAAARAETGIRKLTKAGQPVTFRAVAAAGGVSVDFLYRHPGLRAGGRGAVRCGLAARGGGRGSPPTRRLRRRPRGR